MPGGGLMRGPGTGTLSPQSPLPPTLTSPLCLPSSGSVTLGRNPCTDRNGGCMHTCQALRGLAHCECHAGYRLAADRKACEGKTPLPMLRPPPPHPQGQLWRDRVLLHRLV